MGKDRLCICIHEKECHAGGACDHCACRIYHDAQGV